MTGDFLSSLISLWRDWQTLLALTNVQTHSTDKKQLGGINIMLLNHHKTLTSHLHWLYSSLKNPLYWFCASTHPAYFRDMCVTSSLTKPARPRPKCRYTLFVCVEAAAILEEHHTHIRTAWSSQRPADRTAVVFTFHWLTDQDHVASP